MNQLLSLPRYQFIAAVAALGGFLFASSYAVMAQALEPTGGSGIDLGPVLTTAIGLAATAIGVAGTLLIRVATSYLSAKTGLNKALLDDQFGARLDFALSKGIDFAEAKAKSYVADPKSPIRNVTFDNMFVGWAAQYVVDRVPDTLARFNLTQSGVEQMVLSRLNTIMGTPAVDSGSPAPVNATLSVAA